MRRLFGEPGMREEAKDAEPVIDVHQHHSVAGEDFAVEQSFHPDPAVFPPPWTQTMTGTGDVMGHFGVHTFSCRQSSLWGSCLLSF